MNYMSKIAEMLGVEMGERFKLQVAGLKQELKKDYCFCEKSFCMVSESGYHPDDEILHRVLNGTLEIVRDPWKPKDGDHYWYVEYDEGCALCRTTWSDSSYDLALYKLGKLYRTKAEAEKHADEDAAYWESIREEIDG